MTDNRKEFCNAFQRCSNAHFLASFPGGIGCLGAEAYEFADFLQASGFTIWQVLPVGPTGYGESPYQSTSVFAGNPLFISCRTLRDEGLLTYQDEEEFVPADPEKVDYEAVRKKQDDAPAPLLCGICR